MDRVEAGRAYRAAVDLHGELLMLTHWSMLAYTGLVKILKKHAKRTGSRLAVGAGLERLLDQPFCSLEVRERMSERGEEKKMGRSKASIHPIHPFERGGAPPVLTSPRTHAHSAPSLPFPPPFLHPSGHPGPDHPGGSRDRCAGWRAGG